MKIVQRVVAAALLLFGLAGTAYAQSPAHGIYLGAAGGVSKAVSPADCSIPPPNITTDCDIQDKKAAWRAFFGYQANPYLAFEAGYGTWASSPRPSRYPGFLSR